MRKRVKIGLALMLFGMAAIAGREFLRKPEPRYDGEAISYWLNYNGRTAGFSSFYFPASLTNSNAVPFLIKALNRRDRPFSSAYRAVWSGLPPRFRERLSAPIEARYVRHYAVAQLASLGPIAKPAVPALARVLKEDKDPSVRVAAVGALAYLDDEKSVAVLTQYLDDKQHSVREMVTNELLRIAPVAAANAGIDTNVLSISDEDLGLSEPGKTNAPMPRKEP